MEKLMAEGLAPSDVDAIIDIGGSHVSIMKGKCPCLTRTRCADRAYFSSKRTRCLTINDMLRLQGHEPALWADWERVVTPRVMGGVIGNAMSQAVMERLLRNVCIALGIPVLPNDRWA